MVGILLHYDRYIYNKLLYSISMIGEYNSTQIIGEKKNLKNSGHR